MRCLAVRPSVERCGITGGPCCATSSAMNCAAAWSVGLATTVASPREARYAFTAARSESCSGSAFTAVDCAASAKRTAAKQSPRDSNLTKSSLPRAPHAGRPTLPQDPTTQEIRPSLDGYLVEAAPPL